MTELRSDVLPMIRHTDVLTVAVCQGCQQQVLLQETSSLTAKEPFSLSNSERFEVEGTFIRLQVLDQVADALSNAGHRRSAKAVRRSYEVLLGLSDTSPKPFYSTKRQRFGRKD